MGSSAVRGEFFNGFSCDLGEFEAPRDGWNFLKIGEILEYSLKPRPAYKTISQYQGPLPSSWFTQVLFFSNTADRHGGVNTTLWKRAGPKWRNCGDVSGFMCPGILWLLLQQILGGLKHDLGPSSGMVGSMLGWVQWLMSGSKSQQRASNIHMDSHDFIYLGYSKIMDPNKGSTMINGVSVSLRFTPSNPAEHPQLGVINLWWTYEPFTCNTPEI